ncbi:MAG: hypothetical protein AAF561_04590, partial [Planctomycetota bacterium]
ADRFVPIDFADEMNIYLDRKDQFGGFHNSATFPRPGRHDLGGVPFVLGGTAESGEITYGWNGYYANARYGDGRKPRTLVIKTDLPNVDAVHTIMQTFWSMPHGQSAVAIEFIGSDGARAHVAFSAGVNIRDYNHGHLRPHGAIQVAEVFDNHLGQHLDRQSIDLPDDFLDEHLVEIRLIDTGRNRGHGAWSRAWLIALTAELGSTSVEAQADARTVTH